jgi:16S rRNA (cytosine1402-N4)-methyltransferase
VGSFSHKSVLLAESIEALAIKPDGVYIDGTAGGGGHSFAIASLLGPGGRLIATDVDPEAVKAAGERLRPFGEKAAVIRANFTDMPDILRTLGIAAADGILLDLGVSSHQFDAAYRGFSYNADAPLDMRMSGEGRTAADIVNEADYAQLVRILREYGEEKFAARIASTIVARREKAPITTTFELADAVRASVPAAARRDGNPARQTFQALRIAVNGELDSLGRMLDEALPMLKTGGRLAVITFHSLEDRMVKQRFAGWAQGCICPPDFPVCVCGHKPEAKIIYKKGVTPSEEELRENSRSRSARLRAAEKL